MIATGSGSNIEPREIAVAFHVSEKTLTPLPESCGGYPIHFGGNMNWERLLNHVDDNPRRI